MTGAAADGDEAALPPGAHHGGAGRLVEVDVLGPLEVRCPPNGSTSIPSTPQRRLVTVLALHVDTPVTSTHLEEWLGLSPGALRTSISRVRHTIGDDAVETTAGGYRLHADVDAAAFEHLVAIAPRVDDATARLVLERAVQLWRDDPLSEFSDEAWAEPQLSRLEEEHATAVEDLAVLQLDAGDAPAALLALRELIDLHPYRDRPRALLVRALDEGGRHTEALRAFQDYRALLRDDVGTEPSDALVDLDHAIAVSAGRHHTLPPWPGHPAWTRTRR